MDSPRTAAGHQSGALLLNVFQVAIPHNIVHLLFGVAGMLLARSWSGARAFLVGGGLDYLPLWLYGMISGHDGPAHFVPLNAADDWLHLFLAVGLIALGLLLGPLARLRCPLGRVGTAARAHRAPAPPPC